MNTRNGPKWKEEAIVKSGIVKGRQRFSCKDCNYFFTVNNQGRSIDPYYVVKALQLYIEGFSFREIERLLQVSHVSVMNWGKQFNMRRPSNREFHPAYHAYPHRELLTYLSQKTNLQKVALSSPDWATNSC